MRRRILRGDVYARTVQVPEGYNIYDVAAVVEQAGLGTAADFLIAAKGDLFLIKDLDPNAKTLEGYLFPDTYHFTRIDTAHEIVAGMVHRFRQEAQKIGLLRNGDVHRIVTVASIVEKETAVPEERPHGRQRLLQPAGQEHGSGRRPQRGLCCAAGGTLSRNHLPVGPAVRFSVQHVQISGLASGPDRQSRSSIAASGDEPCSDRLSCISSATTTDIIVFRERRRNTRATWQLTGERCYRRSDAASDELNASG